MQVAVFTANGQMHRLLRATMAAEVGRPLLSLKTVGNSRHLGSRFERVEKPDGI